MRYTNKVAISNNRIIKLKNGKVTFRYKDYSDQERAKIMTFDALEFIRRFLLHVLPDRFVRIRYYGLLSNRSKKSKLKVSRLILKVKLENVTKIEEKESWVQLLFKLTGKDIRICPVCGEGEMIPQEGLIRPSPFKIKNFPA